MKKIQPDQVQSKMKLCVRTRQRIGKPIRAVTTCPPNTEPVYINGKLHGCLIVS